jgi:LacI family transcriptional regulator, galactose operon repressor
VVTDSPRSSAPTIYDVAKVAGVAPSTVSRAFARPGRVNADTAARIRAVAEQLGYRANPIARALSTSKTRMIAVMVSDVANPFYSELIRGTQMAASEEDYVVVLADAQESGTLERETLERLLPVVDGIVIGSSRMSELALRTIAKQTTLVVLNHALTDIPSVVTDNEAGMRAAVAHLRDLGHTAITYVAGPEASWADGVRWRALRDNAREMGLNTRRMGPVDPTFEGGLGIGDEVLAEHVSAVIGYNDLVAIGIMAAVRRSGLRVPRDVSVVGFDDILTSRLTTPPLTTVAAPIRFMGATAVRNLLAMLHGAQPRAGRAYVLPVKLMVRGSTAQRSR